MYVLLRLFVSSMGLIDWSGTGHRNRLLLADIGQRTATHGIHCLGGTGLQRQASRKPSVAGPDRSTMN